jgi:hypothetical protein
MDQLRNTRDAMKPTNRSKKVDTHSSMHSSPTLHGIVKAIITDETSKPLAVLRIASLIVGTDEYREMAVNHYAEYLYGLVHSEIRRGLMRKNWRPPPQMTATSGIDRSTPPSLYYRCVDWRLPYVGKTLGQATFGDLRAAATGIQQRLTVPVKQLAFLNRLLDRQGSHADTDLALDAISNADAEQLFITELVEK